jgi:predicted nucleic acid-binding protein
VARPVVPDTTAFVDAIRRSHQPFFDAVRRGRVWLCAVVACELYAGTRSADEARLVDRLVRGAAEAQRLLVPTAAEWARSGRLIARRVRTQGALRPRDHLADVLIVVSAARVLGEVLTANRQHLEPWAELARRGGLDVTVAVVPLQPSDSSAV